jgi:hypothetical protein
MTRATEHRFSQHVANRFTVFHAVTLDRSRPLQHPEIDPCSVYVDISPAILCRLFATVPHRPGISKRELSRHPLTAKTGFYCACRFQNSGKVHMSLAITCFYAV